MININGKTTIYGIIGDPIAHSLSPLFQNQFLLNVGLNSTYLPFCVNTHNLSQALTGLHAAHIEGLNITVPHKESAMNNVEADQDAKTIGAVNTVKRTDSGWIATNTDWQGFASVLQGLQVNVAGNPVLIFGAGGTARAICHALHNEGAREILICNRSNHRAEKLASDLQSNYSDMKISLLTWSTEDVSKYLSACDVIINTSAVGLNDEDIFPFELNGSGYAIDAVYKQSGKTAFVTAAGKGGFTAVDGLPMLIAQGIASFAYWHKDDLHNNNFDLPDKLESLHWVENKLARQPLQLPGWRT